MTIDSVHTTAASAHAVDPRLTSLIAAAEAGEPCPGIVNLLVGSWFIQGRPVSSETFLQSSFDSLCQSILAVKQPRRSRVPEHDRVQQAQDSVAPGFTAVETLEVDTGSLCLVDVSIAGSSGSSFHPPAIRVAASSVSAWWLTDFEVRAPSRGSDITVGVGVELWYEA